MPAQGGQRISIPVPLSSKRKGTTVHATTTSSDSTVRPDARRLRWRVVDIVVASVIGVAVGVVFWAWGVVWGPISAPIEAVLPGLQAAPAAVWLIAGVLGALIIRKPGAAVYTEVVAATVSALIGTQWGWLTIEAGIVQGLGAELVFALFLLPQLARSPSRCSPARAPASAMAVNDLVLWYAGAAPTFATIYLDLGRHRRRGARRRPRVARGARTRARRSTATASPRDASSGRSDVPALHASIPRPASVDGAGLGLAPRRAARAGRARPRPRHSTRGSGCCCSVPRARASRRCCTALAGVLGGDDDGEAIGRAAGRRPAGRPARGRSGLVLQDPDAQVVMARLGDDVAFGSRTSASRATRSGRASRRRSTRSGSTSRSTTPTAALSGGQRQRLALAGVLAMRPGPASSSTSRRRTSTPPASTRCATPSRTRRDETGATLVVIEHRVSVWLARRRPHRRARRRRRAARRRAPRRGARRPAPQSCAPRASGCPMRCRGAHPPPRGRRGPSAARRPCDLDVARAPGSPVLRGVDAARRRRAHPRRHRTERRRQVDARASPSPGCSSRRRPARGDPPARGRPARRAVRDGVRATC